MAKKQIQNKWAVELIPMDDLVVEARSLRSENGENLEYDRALYELLYYATGNFKSREDAKREVLKVVPK